MPKGRAWTYTEKEKLQEIFKTGKAIKDICLDFPDRTEKSIRREIEKLRNKGVVGYLSVKIKSKRTMMAEQKKKKALRKEELKDGDWGDSDWK